MDAQTITQIFWLVLIVAVVWVVLRFVLRLAGKIFACGCSLLVVAAVVLLLLRFFSKA